MIYLDSCALVKLVLREEETDPLRGFLAARASERHVTCSLALTEVPRAAIRAGADAEVLAAVDGVLSRVARLRLQARLLRTAGSMAGPSLRSLDAIHLAAARRLQPALTAFVTYDKRLLAAAEAAGLPTSAPT